MDEGGLCMLAWKKRTGLGGSFVMNQKWERRWIVVSGSKMVYYSLGKEDAPTPRGVLDLVEQEATIHVPAKNAPDAPTRHELDIVGKSEDESNSAPVSWKLCFDTQQDQLHLLETVHNILYESGQYDEKDYDRFEHDLEAGDHVFRWEMIIMPPVIYPIQIHGIVLEAGRNCVIIGDFGLTGYGKQEGADFNHAEDHNKSMLAAWKKLRPKEDQRLNIVSLICPKDIRKWKKANYENSFVSNHVPKNKLGKSLSKFFGSKKSTAGDGSSIRTDATVVQERERTSSEDTTGSVGGKLSKFFKSTSNVVRRQDSTQTDATVVAECDESSGDAEQAVEASKDAELSSSETGQSGEIVKQSSDDADKVEEKKEEKQPRSNAAEAEESSSEFAEVSLNETDEEPSEATDNDEKPSDAAKVRCDDKQESCNETPQTDENGASRSPSASPRKEPSQSQQQPHQELPKSDPKKIVLARAHFLLEHGEEILPPYHVFFSNSECIAVWCKTGRWSTLQTAVYLTGHSVGAAKSSTMATLGVAAAHAVFAPVVAVGGLIWVSAPMVILQKSRKKWEEATMKLTPLFWEWAPPEVFVEAIENWSDIH